MALKPRFQAVERGFFSPEVQSGIDLEGDDSVAFDSLGHVVRGAAFGEVEFPVQADVFLALVHERVADDPHLREVHLGTSGAEDLALEHRHRRVAPAGAAAALVLDRRRAEDLAFGEAIPLGRIGRLGCGSECEAECESRRKQVFHRILEVFGVIYFFEAATIFRHSSRVSSSGFVPLGMR